MTKHVCQCLFFRLDDDAHFVVVAECPKCSAELAELTGIERQQKVSLGDDMSGARDIPNDSTEDLGYGSASTWVHLGWRVRSARGFVNRGRRHHLLDIPWYYRPPDRVATGSERIRLPAVFTCRCGFDIEVPTQVTPDMRANSTEGSADRDDRLIDELVREDPNLEMLDLAPEADVVLEDDLSLALLNLDPDRNWLGPPDDW